MDHQVHRQLLLRDGCILSDLRHREFMGALSGGLVGRQLHLELFQLEAELLLFDARLELLDLNLALNLDLFLLLLGHEQHVGL